MRRSSLMAIIIAVVVLVLAAGAFLFIREANSVPKHGSGARTGTAASRQSAQGKVTNLLLVCVEDDGDTLSPFLGSDGILLMTINEGTKKVVSTAFLSNTRVEVSHAYPDTLANVYRDGGVQLLKKTLSENFGVLPDYYAVLKAGDLGELKDSNASSLRVLGLSELTALAKTLASKAKTDMSSADMLSFAGSAADMKSYKGASLKIPEAGGYETEIDGEQTVLVPDLEANAAALQTALYE